MREDTDQHIPKALVPACLEAATSNSHSGPHKHIGKLALVGIGLVLALPIGRIARHESSSLPSPTQPLYRAEKDQPFDAPAENQPRKVYPYSVIPGGVISAEELTAKLQADPIARLHYSDFRANRAVLTYARFTRESAYVSYRSGNRIFWTSKRVHIAPTETVLTDGKSFARTRCGNRLSETPQQPTAANEPTEEALLYTPPPVSHSLIQLPANLEFAPPLRLHEIYKLPTVSTVAVLDEVSSRTSVITTRNLTPIGNAPEPASIVFLLSGGLLIGFARFRAIRPRRTPK